MFLLRYVLVVVSILAPLGAVHGGFLVTKTRLSTSTNSFAPLDKSIYFDEEVIENQSPASVSASGDWRGTNFGGGAETWHWTGNSHTDQGVISRATGFEVSASARFNWTMATTPDFVSPGAGVVVYEPGAGAGFRTWFSLTESASYMLSSTLNRYASLSIYSVTTNSAIYDAYNPSNTSVNLNEAGVLPPGDYSVGGGVGAYGVTRMGASNLTRTGSLTNFLFTVRVPEPASLSLAALGLLLLRRRGMRS